MQIKVTKEKDIYYMKKALEEAKKALKYEEVPIGAVLVKDGKIIGKGFNLKETKNDTTYHAEIIAIREASKKLGNWRLSGSSLYTTIEPCPMCAGAILNARIDRLIIGARDFKSGSCGTVINIFEEGLFNHRLDLEIGVLEEECSDLISNFFKELREIRQQEVK